MNNHPLKTARVITPKVWGREELVYNGNVCGKRMVLDYRSFCSWHRHNVKWEIFTVESGDMLLEYGLNEDVAEASRVILREGDSFEVPVGMWHRFTGLNPDGTVFYEFSTRDDPADSIRLIPSGKIAVQYPLPYH
jgi:mannose-6-phosphate isomerase-like protein (cupin superfamily)